MVRKRTPEAEVFGRTLRRLREEKKLSQEALGSAADLTTGYISDLERGLKAPCLATILHLATALDVPPPEMLRDFTQATRKPK